MAKDAELTTAAFGALPPDAWVVAADGGVDAALAMGLAIDVAVGDFDSVSAAGLTQPEAAGARIERHPTAKDATDLELALDEALAAGVDRIVVLASPVGRFDHVLANVLVLARAANAGARITAHLGPATIDIITGGSSTAFTGEAGDVLTLLPVFGTAVGVRTEGLAFPLVDEDLPPGTTRGVSNVLAATTASVALAEGTLVAIRPGPEPAA